MKAQTEQLGNSIRPCQKKIENLKGVGTVPEYKGSRLNSQYKGERGEWERRKGERGGGTEGGREKWEGGERERGKKVGRERETKVYSGLINDLNGTSKIIHKLQTNNTKLLMKLILLEQKQLAAWLGFKVVSR